MSRILITPGIKEWNDPPELGHLDVAECFCDAFQGEGVYSGVPAVFLRLSGCRLNCRWCDTADIWTSVNRISLDSLERLFVSEGLIGLLGAGHHLVVTGGSPLLQQDMLAAFLRRLMDICPDKPFVEIENECSVMVSARNLDLFRLVGCWNCSPKLAGSGVPEHLRYCPDAIRQISGEASESWFKFVVPAESIEPAWEEIDAMFIRPGLVDRRKIILMPEGVSRKELSPRRCRAVAEFAVSRNVRYCGRLHIDLYDTRRSV